MIGELGPYPAYKESRLPWLPNMPSHWDLRRNKLFLREINDRSTHGAEELLTVSRYTGVRRRRDVVPDEDDTSRSAASLVGYKLVRPGDLVMNIMLAWNGSLGVAPVEGITSPAYSVFRARPGIQPWFFHYLFRTPLFSGIFKTVSTGVVDSRLRLYPEVFFRLPSPVPPEAEQAAIVRFLDHADRRIRRYIRAKRKLIALLNEQKQAIIHRALTRGLDPTVRLKPSGVEWLGEVPEHWNVRRIGRLTEIVPGFAFKSDGFSEDEADIRLLRGINVSAGRIRWQAVVRWPRSDRGNFARFELAPGDVVLGMDRPIISSGTRVAIVRPEDVPALLLQRVARLRGRPGLDNEFLFLLITNRNFADYLAPIFTGVSVPHISPEQIAAYRVALPPVSEQQAIVGWVRKHTAVLDAVTETAYPHIQFLLELRSRLIADVVTGRLDVREAAAHLPDEPDETEADEPEWDGELQEGDLVAAGAEPQDDD